MPSLHCNLRCPHCYLTLEQRKDETILSTENVVVACNKVDEYYLQRGVKNKTIVIYWYGGEPTDMGQEYFTQTVDAMNGVFSEEKGYSVKHVVLSSLNTVDKSWYPILHKYGNGYLQTSYDGLMRGKGYLRKWERKMAEVIDYGFDMATISVVNNELLIKGPVETLSYLADMGVCETSWLPFMWNEQNNGTQYDTYAPTMDNYSKFMIELSEEYLRRKENNIYTPEIGQLSFILGQANLAGSLSNIAAQTLFLLPNGDFVLPDYQNGFQEYMRYFGNILETDFDTVLKSPHRRDYLKKQVLKNNNFECLSCNHSDKCIMEFWKDNRRGDDCFGAQKYVQWLMENRERFSRYVVNPLLF